MRWQAIDLSVRGASPYSASQTPLLPTQLRTAFSPRAHLQTGADLALPTLPAPTHAFIAAHDGVPEPFTLTLGYEHVTVDAVLRRLLPATVTEVPSSFEQVMQPAAQPLHATIAQSVASVLYSTSLPPPPTSPLFMPLSVASLSMTSLPVATLSLAGGPHRPRQPPRRGPAPQAPDRPRHFGQEPTQHTHCCQQGLHRQRPFRHTVQAEQRHTDRPSLGTHPSPAPLYPT